MNWFLFVLLIIGSAIAVVWAWRVRSGFVAVIAAVMLLASIAMFDSGNPEPIAMESEQQSKTPDLAADKTAAIGGSLKSKRSDLTLTRLEPFRPQELPTNGYVGSDACQECHAENHATWAASYHHTMTQVADPEIVLGDFRDVEINHDGRLYKLSMENGICTADFPDEADPTTRHTVPIVMTTGSHHMQVYWFTTGEKRLLGMLPLVYLKDSQEWVPRESAFLVPPHQPPSTETGRWNETCSACHTTQRKGRRLASGQWDTHVGEFGISCEACHGPGQGHLDYQRGLDGSQPNQTVASASDPIVNPAKLSKVLSSQVCGQCHAVLDPLHMDLHYQENGHRYRPGMDLRDTHGVWNRDTPEYVNTMKTLDYPDLDTLLNETYYPDGMIRVSGREYNGLIESSCYINGEMSCMSCHQLHQSASDTRSLTEWANDQLKPQAIGDQACVDCHAGPEYGPAHTHHAIGSSGAQCYNCHMPHTAYGLLKAIRNHQISSPDVGKDERVQRPNACNLCHLDQTLQWSANHLQQWYGIEPPELDAQQQQIAGSLLWLLRGNAAERALTAWSMGWEDAQQASGDDWQLPFLSALLDDDYDAVRLIARRTIKSLPGASDFELDVVTSSTSDQRQRSGLKLLQSWLKTPAATSIDRPELLITQPNGIDVLQIKQLLDQRDQSRMLLSE
ncbi:cytochrome c3 family protein [Stieleria sp. TO1_6]|uniref:cytochrome c3 family protein n=1 Tax=Stieleria tagensis TaxID=2956795 RepID=UPI00209A64A9|nr:cytochrome c3 family protein [Stieleria tagensis]MCO8124681.1 cytochrome c3 family protein [Stieleria tagensis]